MLYDLAGTPLNNPLNSTGRKTIPTTLDRQGAKHTPMHREVRLKSTRIVVRRDAKIFQDYQAST